MFLIKSGSYWSTFILRRFSMSLVSFQHWLKEASSQPSHPFYHPIQATLFASLSYAGTMCFTSIPPIRAMTFAVLAYAISQFVAPLFSELLEPYQEVELVPLTGQVLQLSTSLILAKVICSLAGLALSCKEIRKVCVVFLVSFCIFRLVIVNFFKQIAKLQSLLTI
jgi:hypothetical protein